MMRALFQRIADSLVAKLLIGGGVLMVCGIMYSLLQRVHLGAPHVQPACPVSALLPFEPRWTPLYLSMFAMVGVAWLLCGRAQLRRLACAILGAGLVAWLFFFFLPMECPRPALPVDAPWDYRAMIWFDAPVNCFPSLHGAFTLIAALVIRREVGGMAFLTRATRVLAQCVLCAWGAGVLVSILVLRQHTAIDVAAGVALGALAGHAIKTMSPARTCS